VGTTLPENLSMGPVSLKVANMDLVVKFYRDAVGLDVVSDEGATVVLGQGVTPTLVLQHSPSLRHAGPSEAGLFHTALLFSTPSDLASAVASVARTHPSAFTGSADHLVSEAFYFDDPEGNGVELYVDRDRSGWGWQHGQITMDTLPLDPNAYLAKHLTDQPVQASVVGHVHLSVGNIDQAKSFYVDTLGFDITLNWGGTALFVSAGGYHHHMAMNVWRSRGAGRRQQTLGLGEVTIDLPSLDALGEIEERMHDFQVPLRNDGHSITVDDPWGNLVTVRAR
jgi:catechol 2,3-dioxygenase